MVGAINPNASTSIGHQKQRARDSAYMLNPGESFPPESPTSSATPGPDLTPLSYTPASKPSTGKKNHNLSAGVIAGIVVGTIAVIFLGALVFLSRRNNRTLKKNSPHGTEHVPFPPIKPSASQFNPSASQFNPSASQFNPSASQFNPSASQFNPPALQFNPSAQQFSPLISPFSPTVPPFSASKPPQELPAENEVHRKL
jgi:hypothetical protein